MKAVPPPERLPTLLLAGIAGLLAVFLLAGALFAVSEREKIITEAKQDLSAIADLKTAQISLWWRERVGDAQILPATPGMAEEASRALRLATGSPERRTMAEWLEGIRRSFGYRTVYLLDPDGAPKIGTGEDPEEAVVAAREAAREAARTRKLGTLDLHPGPGGMPVLDLWSPWSVPARKGSAPE